MPTRSTHSHGAERVGCQCYDLNWSTETRATPLYQAILTGHQKGHITETIMCSHAKVNHAIRPQYSNCWRWSPSDSSHPPLPVIPNLRMLQLQVHDLTLVPTELAGYRNKTSKSARIQTATEGKVPRALTAMRSRSHQGMLSPPVKKLPTDSKKRSILASIDLLSVGGDRDPRRWQSRGGLFQASCAGMGVEPQKGKGDSISARSLRTRGMRVSKTVSRVFVTDMWDPSLGLTCQRNATVGLLPCLQR